MEALIELMKLKLISKSCGFSRIYNKKPNILIENTLEEAAFRSLRKGIPEHLRSRFIYQKDNNGKPLIIIRGIGSLPSNKQIEQLIEWFKLMESQVPNNESMIS